MPAEQPTFIAESGRPRFERWLPWLLAAVVLLAFSPVITAEFVKWDDPHNTFDNPRISSPSPGNVLYFWSHAYKDLYIPVTYTVWAVISVAARTQTPDALGATLNPYLFHAANLLVHVAGSILVYQILRLLFRFAVPAALGAALFGLHPTQVESVAWVSGLKDVLAGCLALAALYLYFRHATEQRWQPYALATLCFILAMLSKPSAVTVPLLAALLDYLLLRRPIRRVLLSAGPWLLLAIPVIIIGKLAQPAMRLEFVPPLYARPLVALDALGFYLYKLVAPLHLAIDYGRSPRWLWSSPQLFWTWTVPVAVTATLLLLRKRFPIALVAAAAFALALLPTLGLVPFDFQAYSTTADHYLYLAMLAPALLLAAALGRARFPPSRGVEPRPGSAGALPSPARHALPTVAALIILAACAVRTFTQSLHWRDSESLFSHTVAVNPSSLAGNVQLGNLRYNAAIALFDPEHIRRLPPDQRLSAALQGKALLEEAAALYERARRTAPNDPDVHYNLGNALFYLNRRQEAADHYRFVVQAIADDDDKRLKDARTKLSRLASPP